VRSRVTAALFVAFAAICLLLSTIGLYGVSRHDFATIAGVAVLMCLVTGVATYIPARRAASVDPIAALREG
jgi:ABC-type lipoprotein release transport system permease subunit